MQPGAVIEANDVIGNVTFDFIEIGIFHAAYTLRLLDSRKGDPSPHYYIIPAITLAAHTAPVMDPLRMVMAQFLSHNSGIIPRVTQRRKMGSEFLR